MNAIWNYNLQWRNVWYFGINLFLVIFQYDKKWYKNKVGRYQEVATENWIAQANHQYITFLKDWKNASWNCNQLHPKVWHLSVNFNLRILEHDKRCYNTKVGRYQEVATRNWTYKVHHQYITLWRIERILVEIAICYSIRFDI